MRKLERLGGDLFRHFTARDLHRVSAALGTSTFTEKDNPTHNIITGGDDVVHQFDHGQED